MGINLDAFRNGADVFIDYDFEEVMFRWEAATRKVFRKFYGAQEEPLPIDRTNRLCNEAIGLGIEIDFETYSRGRARGEWLRNI
jgi:hypothetical protein